MLQRIKQALGLGPKKPVDAPSAGAAAPPLSHGEAAYKTQPATPPLAPGEATFKARPATEPPLKPGEAAHKGTPGAEPPLADEGEK